MPTKNIHIKLDKTPVLRVCIIVLLLSRHSLFVLSSERNDVKSVLSLLHPPPSAKSKTHTHTYDAASQLKTYFFLHLKLVKFGNNGCLYYQINIKKKATKKKKEKKNHW